jgi:uncharacterized protein YecT (DUF1311 family)
MRLDPMKAALPLAFCLWASLAGAAAPSCLQAASDAQAFDECAQKEILPLETRRVHALSALRTKYRSDPQLLEGLESSENAWNAYRNAYCGTEAAARGGASAIETRRAYQRCARRVLELHVKDLESL